MTVVEDNVRDTLHYYLDPLNRFIHDNRDLCGEHIVAEVWVLGESKPAAIAELSDRPRVSVSVKTSETWEKDEEQFFAALSKSISKAALVLVDRSVRGRAWPDPLDEQRERWADVIANRLRELHKNGDPPIISVSDQRAVPPIENDEELIRQRQLVWKHRRLDTTEKYYSLFAAAVAFNLRSNGAEKWPALISPKASNLITYLRNLEKIDNDWADRREAAEAEATRSLRSLLLASSRSTNLGDAISSDEFAGRRRKSAHDHSNALRRMVLFGLQKAWWTLGPGRGREPNHQDPEYVTWLEVVACECHDYHRQLQAIEGIVKRLQAGELKCSDQAGLTVPLLHDAFTSVGGRRVDGARLVPDDDDVDYESGSVQFFEGEVVLLADGRPEPRDGRNSAMIKFAVSWPGVPAASVPWAGRPDQWKAFWSGRPTPQIIRNGHSVYTRQNLARWDRIGFDQDQNVFRLFQKPAPHERRWWYRVRDDLVRDLAALPQGNEIWNARVQSKLRAEWWPKRLTFTGRQSRS